jgi:hypothetical protein
MKFIWAISMGRKMSFLNMILLGSEYKFTIDGGYQNNPPTVLIFRKNVDGLQQASPEQRWFL